MTSPKTKLGILISGRGSNMQSIVAACREGRIPAEVALVVSNKAQAPGIAWAADEGLPTCVLSHRDYENREAHDRAVVAELRRAGVEWVCLAGYMRLLSPYFVEACPDRILNIHPSLLPAFPGLNAQAQAFDYGVRVTGCTVHLVDRELDHGPVVLQRAMAIADDDTLEDLERRLIAIEHETYVEALWKILTAAWRIEGRRLVFS